MYLLHLEGVQLYMENVKVEGVNDLVVCKKIDNNRINNDNINDDNYFLNNISSLPDIPRLTHPVSKTMKKD